MATHSFVWGRECDPIVVLIFRDEFLLTCDPMSSKDSCITSKFGGWADPGVEECLFTIVQIFWYSKKKNWLALFRNKIDFSQLLFIFPSPTIIISTIDYFFLDSPDLKARSFKMNVRNRNQFGLMILYCQNWCDSTWLPQKNAKKVHKKVNE